jgi:hypothetical protein
MALLESFAMEKTIEVFHSFAEAEKAIQEERMIRVDL